MSRWEPQHWEDLDREYWEGISRNHATDSLIWTWVGEVSSFEAVSELYRTLFEQLLFGGVAS